MKKILISGSSGLTGSQVVKRLIKSSDLKETTLILGNREPNKGKRVHLNIKEEIVSDFKNSDEWVRLIKKYEPDEIVNISNIRHSRPLMEALWKLKRSPNLYIVGTTAVHSIHRCCNEEYRSLEKLIREYEGNYCIIRPSMIYGSVRDKNMHKVIDFISKYKFFPIFGNGKNLMQPVYYKDLAYIIERAIEKQMQNIALDVAGAKSQTYESLIDEVFKALSLKKNILKLPIQASKRIINMTPKFIRRKLPVTYEQLIRLQEDKQFCYKEASKLLKYKPTSFEKGIREQVNEIYS